MILESLDGFLRLGSRLVPLDTYSGLLFCRGTYLIGMNRILSRQRRNACLCHGNITAIATDAGRTSYTYDRLGRLTDAKPDDKHRQLGLPEEHYLYDKVGNRTASAHQNGIWRHNQDNQLTSYPRYFSTLADGSVMNEDIAVSYTQTGHTKEEKGLNWERQYSYNAAERLSKVEDKRNYRTASYTYDPFGRRISKTIAQGKASATTYYIYGEHGLMAEANEQGTLTKAYGFHPDAQASGLWGTNPIWQADISNGKLKDEQTQWHYLHTDNLGTPFMATNKQGQKTWRAHANSFGEAIIDKNSTTTVNLRFPGQYFDEETQTHYNFQRDYNPYTGRYLQADPIGLNGGLHLYRYAYNSPLMYMDPEGEWVNIAGGAILGFAFNVGYQLWYNNWRVKCVDWLEVTRWTVGGALIGVLVPEAIFFRGGMQTVTRWGPKGKWVMTGGRSRRNWLLSGIHRRYAFSDAVTTQVPRRSLAWPPGWEKFKGLWGQRVIKGSAIGGASTSVNAKENNDNNPCGCE